MSTIMNLRASVVRSCCWLALAGAAGCGSDAPPITGKEWVVVALGDRIAPVGSGGHLLTLILDDSTDHVSGFSGCNQYGGSYSLSGDTLKFGPLVSTKMMCIDAIDLESIYLAALPTITTWRLSDSTLTLSGAGAVAVKLR